MEGLSSNNEEFQRLMDEILAPIDIESFPFDLECSEFIFDSGLSLDPDPASEGAGKQTEPIDRPSGNEQDNLKVIQLESRIKKLEAQISILDKYVAELIPWTVEIKGRVNKLSEMISK